MKFGSHEVGCWVEYWSIKGKFISYHCESHYVHLFLLGPNVSENTAICDLGALGDFVPVDGKKLLVPVVSPMPWKRRLISLDKPLLHSSLLGPFTRCRYYCAFHVSGQMTAFIMPGWRVRLPVAWYITSQSSTVGNTGGAGLLGA